MVPMNIKSNRHICNTMLPNLKILDDELDMREIESKRLGVSMKNLGKALKQC